MQDNGKNIIYLSRQHMSNRLVNPEFREIMAVPFWNLPTFYQQPRAGATIQYTFLIIIYSINNLRSWKKEHYPLPFPRAFCTKKFIYVSFFQSKKEGKVVVNESGNGIKEPSVYAGLRA